MTENKNKVELCGLLVSRKVADAALDSWPKRRGIGYDDHAWQGVCANHVLLVARSHGEEPEIAPRQQE